MEIVCPAWYPGTERLIDAIQLLAEQGVTAVEIHLNHKTYFKYHEPFELQSLLSELNLFGIRIHSIHSPFGPQFDISDPNDQIHDRGVDAILETIELANILDARYVIVHASDFISDNSIKKRMDRAHGVLKELSAIAKESDIVLALENLPPGYLGHTPEEINKLLNGTDVDTLGVCFDTGHANLSGEFTRFADELLPISVTTHIHDNNGKDDQHLFPGDGIINWKEFAKSYRQSAKNLSIMIEYTPPLGFIWSDAFQRIRFLLES